MKPHHLRMRIPARRALIALAILAGGTLAWAAGARIEGAASLTGVVAPERTRPVLAHAEGGTVAALLVREGSPVKVGQPLIRLDGSALEAEAAILRRARDRRALHRARLRAESRGDGTEPIFPPELLLRAESDEALRSLIEDERRHFRTRRDARRAVREQNRRREAEIARRIEGLDTQIAAAERQAALIAEDLDRARALSTRGLGTRDRLRAFERAAAEHSGRQGQLIAARAMAREESARIALGSRADAADARAAALSALGDLDRADDAARLRLELLRGRLAALVIRAPVSGVVHGLTAPPAPGVVRAAAPLMSIVEDAAPRVARLRIPAHLIARIGPGTRARIIPADGDAEGGRELTGRIERISADRFADPGGGGVYFRAEVALNDGPTDGPDDGGPADGGPGSGGSGSGGSGGGSSAGRLKPGTPVEAIIRMGPANPLAALFAPLATYLDRGPPADR